MAQAAGTTPLSIATEPAFQSALQAATGNETDIAKLHTKHISDFGGYYLADVSFQIHTHIHEYAQTYTQCGFGTNAVMLELILMYLCLYQCMIAYPSVFIFDS